MAEPIITPRPFIGRNALLGVLAGAMLELELLTLAGIYTLLNDSASYQRI